jgi:hypothetical protein
MNWTSVFDSWQLPEVFASGINCLEYGFNSSCPSRVCETLLLLPIYAFIVWCSGTKEMSTSFS